MEIEPVVLELMWLLPLGLLIAAAFITFGLINAFRALCVWWCRDLPIDDPVIAKFLKGLKPPPYLTYAIVWTGAGVILATLCISAGALR